MPWQRLGLVVEGARAAALGEALEAEGAIAIDLADADAGTADERAIFGEPGAELPAWPRCRLTALFPDGADVDRALAAGLDAAGAALAGGASLDRLEDADWVSLTQRQFAPIRAGQRLWIVPSWHEPPEPGAVNIVLDPGAAFGTGSHPTTRLCLGWLEREVRPEDRVLDYGCGSGILAIAAMRLGAAAAVAVDVDPLALEAARYNSRNNGVALDVRDAHDASAEAASLTVANILANPLRLLAPLLAAATRPGGRIALSGILEEQAGELIDAYAPYARLAVAGREAGWVLLAGERQA